MIGAGDTSQNALELRSRADGDIQVITVTGEVDVCTAPQLRELVLHLANARECRWFVIDLERCLSLDVTGLGVLVGALKRARMVSGAVVIVCTREPVCKMFRITGLTKVLPLFDTVEDAVAALRSSSSSCRWPSAPISAPARSRPFADGRIRARHTRPRVLSRRSDQVGRGEVVRLRPAELQQPAVDLLVVLPELWIERAHRARLRTAAGR